MSIGLSQDTWERNRDAILGGDGLDLLGLVRTLRLSHSLTDIRPEIVRSAVELGWCRERRGLLRLTELGWIVADSAREYINWINDGRRLEPPLEAEVSGKRVLDVGCGWGRYVLTLKNMGIDCAGIDPSKAYLQLGEIFAEREGVDHLPTICGRAEELPFDDEDFDLVCCVRSFAYMNQRHALREFSRVLKPTGRLIIATPTIEMWLERWRGDWAKLSALRGRLRWLLSSYSVHWFGARPLFWPAGLKNAAYPTLSFMTRLEEEYGFRRVEPYPTRHGETAWFVLERSR